MFTSNQEHPKTQSLAKVQAHSPYDGIEYDAPEDQRAAVNARKFVTLMGAFTDQHIRYCQRPHVSQLRPHLRQKIRVAIIDSGVRKDDSRIIGALGSRAIAQGRNFLPGEPPGHWDDVHGHGTHITGLLLSMAPEAEIYIAKVTDGLRVDRKHVNCIAQAINWAVQEWQVDIITMSFVLQEKHESIEAELTEALKPSYEGEGVRRRIVFAAAGNCGANDVTPWPANMPNVIATHATDGLGTASDINTPANGPFNFATLGRAIPVRWKVSGKPPKDVFVSGTSFATPIAAAIASNVLEYARWNLNLTQDQKKLFYSGAYMTKLFERMRMKKGDYEYLQPWTLWRHGYGQRKDIRDVLMDIVAMG